MKFNHTADYKQHGSTVAEVPINDDMVQSYEEMPKEDLAVLRAG